jgi:hypothetical protein
VESGKAVDEMWCYWVSHDHWLSGLKSQVFQRTIKPAVEKVKLAIQVNLANCSAYSDMSSFSGA